MATLSSLLEYYYETMQEALFPLEEERKRIVKKLQTVALFMSIGAVVFFYRFTSTHAFCTFAGRLTQRYERLFDFYVCLPSRKSGFYGTL
ncbi:MAG: hypothetical protein LRY52_08765 [Sulfurospirillum cavolei]|nr:hypothetical protein [Sulfurospirillum cavolei]